jgi:transposase
MHLTWACNLSSISSLQFLLALIDHTPDIYLDEIQEELYLQHDVDVSLATISRTMKRLGLSSKKVLPSFIFFAFMLLR